MIKELDRRTVYDSAFTAAAILRDPDLIPSLLVWEDALGREESRPLQRALEACREQAALEGGVVSLSA